MGGKADAPFDLSWFDRGYIKTDRYNSCPSFHFTCIIEPVGELGRRVVEVEVAPCSSGWSVDVTIDDTHRGSASFPEICDMRFAMREGIWRFA